MSESGREMSQIEKRAYEYENALRELTAAETVEAKVPELSQKVSEAYRALLTAVQCHAIRPAPPIAGAPTTQQPISDESGNSAGAGVETSGVGASVGGQLNPLMDVPMASASLYNGQDTTHPNEFDFPAPIAEQE